METVKQFDTSHFDFAIRGTRTMDVIRDVAEQRSEPGILFRSRHNKKVLTGICTLRQILDFFCSL